MSIIELLSPFRDHIASRSWDLLERDAAVRSFASDRSGICERISAVDTGEYEEMMVDEYAARLNCAAADHAQWVAFNYLTGREWMAIFTMGEEMPPAPDVDTEAYPEDVCIIAVPRLEAFAELWREAAGLGGEEAEGARLLLAARTVALFGRVTELVPSEGFAIVVAQDGEAPFLQIPDATGHIGDAPRLVTVMAYSRPFEAQFAHARLEAHGITAYINDAYTVGMNWLYSNAIGGVKLQVADRDLEAARAVLSEEVTAELADLVETDPSFRCPACGSGRTHHVPIKAPWYRALWGSVILLLGLPAPMSSDDMVCDECGAEWKAEET